MPVRVLSTQNTLAQLLRLPATLFFLFRPQSSGACGPQRRSDLYSSDCDDDAGPAEEQKEEFGLLDDCPAVEECFPYMLQVAGGTELAVDSSKARMYWGVHHPELTPGGCIASRAHAARGVHKVCTGR